MSARHDESATNIARTKATSKENLSNLLDDIKTTVTRTAQHLDSANTAKAREVQFSSPANTTSVVEKSSSSPAGGRKIYKSSRYEYSTSGADGKKEPKSYESVEPANTSQLDDLLDDLRKGPKFSADKDAGIDAGLLEPNSHTTKTTRTVTTTSTDKPFNRKLNSPTLVRKVMNQRSGSNSPSYPDIDSQVRRDVKIETEPVKDITPNANTTRTYNYSKTGSSTRNVPLNTEIVEMDTTDLPAELKNVSISSDLLPAPGTKVTTTIKTFSYEIPNDTNAPTNKNFEHKKEFYNSQISSSTHYPERDVVAPLKNTNIHSSEIHNKNTVHPLNPPPGTNQTYYYKKEVNETKNNIYGSPEAPLPVNKITSLYEHNETNDTRNVFPPTTNGILPKTLPPHQPGTNQTYMYKKETTNTTNTVYAPPPEPVTNKYYKYSSTSTTNTHSRPIEREPLLAPFPTQDIQTTHVDGPPKNLNQLLATFEEDTVRVDEEPYVARKEVNTALAEPKSLSKNVTGPPVYYPPGKELFSKSEAQARWRAQGGQAKGSGKYEYEAESKSKSASKSGAAVVPVCLPLCCAMPCSIM